jgi:hypothetical protein
MYQAAFLADGVAKDVPHIVKYKVMQLVNKIIIKYTIVSALYHYDIPSYFLFILASFSTFSWHLYLRIECMFWMKLCGFLTVIFHRMSKTVP